MKGTITILMLQTNNTKHRQEVQLRSNKALQTDKVYLSCLLHSQKARWLAFAAELGRYSAQNPRHRSLIGSICRQRERTVNARAPRTSIAQPVPELPVADVERAQQHYRDALGFDIAWLYPGKDIGAVSRGDVAIFFRKRVPPFESAVHWVFAENIDATYCELKSSGANIVDPLEQKPWGLMQFTVEDLDGNRFYFHHD
jgi:uncharacterized glyoxalase superfamily protein PhnB